MSGEDHKRLYKNLWKDEDELRRKRSDDQVQLRNQRKDKILSEKRKMQTGAGDEGAGERNVAQQSNFDNDIINQIVHDLRSDYDCMRLRGLQSAYQLGSQIFPPVISQLISYGIVDTCVDFIQKSDNAEARFLSAWVIASVTVTNKDIIMQSKVIPSLIQMLGSPHPELVEQICRALGNCMHDASHIQDELINMGLIPSLVFVLNIHGENLPVMRKLAWTISIIVQKRRDHRYFTSVLGCFPALVKLIASEDSEVLENICTCFSHLCEGYFDNKVSEVIEAGVVPRLITLLDCGHTSIALPSLCAIRNIAASTIKQAQVIINSGVIPILMKLLQNKNWEIVETAASVLANITAGTLCQISAVVESGVVPMLFNVIEKGSSFPALSEAIKVVRNIITGGFIAHFETLRELGLIRLLYRCLNTTNWRVVQYALDGIELILETASSVNHLEEMQTFLDESGCLEKMDQLIFCRNRVISEKVIAIVDSYFDDEKRPDTIVDKERVAMDIDDGGDEQMDI